MVFPKTMTSYGHVLEEDAIVCVKGRLDLRDDDPKIIAMELTQPEVVLDGGPPVRIRVKRSALTNDKVEGLKEVLRLHPGHRAVYVHLEGPDRTTVLTSPTTSSSTRATGSTPTCASSSAPTASPDRPPPRGSRLVASRAPAYPLPELVGEERHDHVPGEGERHPQRGEDDPDRQPHPDRSDDDKPDLEPKPDAGRPVVALGCHPSSDLLDDAVGEPSELLAQGVEVEAQRGEHDAIDAVISESPDPVDVHDAARGDLDRLGVAPCLLGAGAHLVEQRDEV